MPAISKKANWGVTRTAINYKAPRLTKRVNKNTNNIQKNRYWWLNGAEPRSLAMEGGADFMETLKNVKPETWLALFQSGKEMLSPIISNIMERRRRRGNRIDPRLMMMYNNAMANPGIQNMMRMIQSQAATGMQYLTNKGNQYIGNQLANYPGLSSALQSVLTNTGSYLTDKINDFSFNPYSPYQQSYLPQPAAMPSAGPQTYSVSPYGTNMVPNPQQSIYADAIY